MVNGSPYFTLFEGRPLKILTGLIGVLLKGDTLNLVLNVLSEQMVFKGYGLNVSELCTISVRRYDSACAH